MPVRVRPKLGPRCRLEHPNPLIAETPGMQEYRVFDLLQFFNIPGFIDKAAVFGYNLLIIGDTAENALFHGQPFPEYHPCRFADSSASNCRRDGRAGL